MRRAPSCLFLAAFLSFGPIAPDRALAEGVGRVSPPAVSRSRYQHVTGSPRHVGREHGLGHLRRAGDRQAGDRRLPFRPRLHPGAYSKPHLTGRSKDFRLGRHGFASRRPWLWPHGETTRDEAAVMFDEGPAPAPHPVHTGIPSIADLPVSAGIRSAPPASPVVYVVSHGRRSVRRGGVAKVETMDVSAETEVPRTGPRVIPVTVPRGR